jgi:GNAT superfamily N-acetyltransferase
MDESATNIRTRIALRNEASQIATVLHDAFIEYQPLYTQAGFAATALASEQLLERMREGPLWVALRDDIIVGTVSAVLKEERLYLRGMAILPQSRGQRIGELLLSQIEAFAAEQGFHRLFLSTTPFLSRAIRLYEKWGFQRTAEGPHDLFGTPLFTMEKILTTESQRQRREM